MLDKTRINMKLIKIQNEIYDLENVCFKTTNNINKLVNEISELVSIITEKHKKPKKLSDNLYSGDYSPEDENACLYCPDGTEIIIEKKSKCKK